MVGTVVGNPSLVASPWAGFGNALQFNGTSDYVTLGPNVPSVCDGNPFTIEAKINITSFANYPVIMARYDGSSYSKQNFLFYVLGDGRLAFLFRTGPKSFLGVDGPSPIVPGVNYDVAVVYDAQHNVNVFSNGHRGFIDNGKVASPDLTIPVNIGSIGNSGFLSGKMDEIRISKVARYDTNQDYTPSTQPFVADADTAYLAHFDSIMRTVD